MQQLKTMLKKGTRMKAHGKIKGKQHSSEKGSPAIIVFEQMVLPGKPDKKGTFFFNPIAISSTRSQHFICTVRSFINNLKLIIMSKFKVLLISSLAAILQVVADLFESFMVRFGLIRWAQNMDPNISNTFGTIGRWVLIHRLGRSLVRGRATFFHIKDPTVWQKRWAKFRAYIDCARFMKFNLHSLFEGNEFHRTWWSLLCSQLSRFWIKKMDGTYLFSPGVETVSIGNGTMPDARDVVFSSVSLNTLTIVFDVSVQFAGLENNDDTLQLMIIDLNGQYSYWVDLPSVTRSAGTATYAIPASFGSKIYAAVKFKAGADLSNKVKGIFRFPQGMEPVTIMRPLI
jgi:hypothetical protein